MAECRFFPECARCNEVGDSWFPCEGGADGTRCADYAPMPDADALLELAGVMQDDAAICPHEDCREHIEVYARRIREALGVES